MSTLSEWEIKQKKIKENIVTKADQIIAWCDEQVKDGSILTIEWDGGNDSGSFYLRINDADVNNKYDDPEDIPNLILEKADDILEYGSFAGDFNTQGTLTYDPKTKRFSGTDHYSESEGATLGGEHADESEKIEIIIKVPKDLWFDVCHIECAIGDSLTAFEEFNAQLQVLQGPVTDKHKSWVKDLEGKLFRQIEKIMSGVEQDIEYSHNDWIISRGDFKEEGKYLVYKIDEFHYSYYNNTDKEVEIAFKDEDYDEED